MPTGLQMYDALRTATHSKPIGTTVAVNPIDAIDLQKLTVSDLVSRGFNTTKAEEVSSALLRGDIEPLGRAMGLVLETNQNVTALFQRSI